MEKYKKWFKNNPLIVLSIFGLIIMNLICYVIEGRFLHLSTNVVIVLITMMNFGVKFRH